MIDCFFLDQASIVQNVWDFRSLGETTVFLHYLSIFNLAGAGGIVVLARYPLFLFSYEYLWVHEELLLQTKKQKG